MLIACIFLLPKDTVKKMKSKNSQVETTTFSDKRFVSGICRDLASSLQTMKNNNPKNKQNI